MTQLASPRPLQLHCTHALKPCNPKLIYKNFLYCLSSPEFENPSCLQAMFASTVDQPSSHTVPQSPSTHTSTLPSKLDEPPISLILPAVHPTNVKIKTTAVVTPVAINFSQMNFATYVAHSEHQNRRHENS